MTKHNPLPVHGYSAQPDEKVQAVNTNKQFEEKLLRLIESQASTIPDMDMRWLAIAKTHFEQGFMAFNRAIFKPARIRLTEDD